MIELRNRGRYSTAIREEFQNVADTLGTFLSQIFDADGNFIRPEQQSVIKYISPVLDIAINNGNTEGSTLIPQTVNTAKTEVRLLGQKGGGGGGTTNDCQIYSVTSTRVFARRNGSTGDANVSCQVTEYF